MTPLRLGTRGSPLALWQARYVAQLVGAASPGVSVALVEIQTTGDQVRDVPLTQLGGEGAFTKAIQQAILDGRVDGAVHSLKDLPTFAVANLVLAAVPPRGPTGDALIAKQSRAFSALPAGAVIATSSLRRRAQLLHRRGDIVVDDIRGNVETRLRKLMEAKFDAIVLAQAGLERMGWADKITEVLDASWMLPAVGQGALGVECRADDARTRDLLTRIDDRATHEVVLAERALLRGLGGGCQVPIGALTTRHADQITLRGVVLSPDGRRRIEGELTRPARDPQALGQALADDLLARGAREILGNPG